MSQTNAQVKSLLLDAQSIVESKLQQFSADTAVDQSKVTSVQKKVNDEISAFRDPQIWLHTVVLDRAKVFSCMLAINKVNVPDVDALTTELNTLIKILDNARAAIDTTNAAADDSKSATGPPNRNQEALAGLQNIRRKVLGRIQFFMAKGIDLATDATFKPLEARQKPLRENYTKALRNESVFADEMDVLFLNGFADSIQIAKTLPPFFQLYGKLSDFIEERLPTPNA